MKTTKKKTRSSRKAVERRLVDLERRLTHELHEHLGNLHNVARGQPSDLLDIASEGELDSMSAMSAEAGSATIVEVRQALQKLRQGTYGVCDVCRKPIAERRLRARPFAVLCISCKETQERRGYAGGAPGIPVRGDSVAISLTDDDLHDMEGAGPDLLRDVEDLEINEMF